MESARIRIRAQGPVKPAQAGGRAPVLPPRPVWMDNAACDGTDDPLFFDPNNEPDRAKEAAERYCDRCPVRVVCLAYAMKTHSHDVWAGTTLNQRKSLARYRTRVKCPVCTCVTLITVDEHELCVACGVSWHVENRPKTVEHDETDTMEEMG